MFYMNYVIKQDGLRGGYEHTNFEFKIYNFQLTKSLTNLHVYVIIVSLIYRNSNLEIN